MNRSAGELVAGVLELLVVVDREIEDAAGLVDVLADLLGVADRVLLPGPLEAPVERVHADHADRRRRGDDGGRAVVAVHQQDVRAHGVAADLDVLGKSGEDPDAAAAVEAAGGLEVHRGADQLVDELEGLDVLDDAVALADDRRGPGGCPGGRWPTSRRSLRSGAATSRRRWRRGRGRSRSVRVRRATRGRSARSPRRSWSAARSSTAPRPCQGVSRTENIESLLVIPAGMTHSL